MPPNTLFYSVIHHVNSVLIDHVSRRFIPGDYTLVNRSGEKCNRQLTIVITSTLGDNGHTCVRHTDAGDEYEMINEHLGDENDSKDCTIITSLGQLKVERGARHICMNDTFFTRKVDHVWHTFPISPGWAYTGEFQHQQTTTQYSLEGGYVDSERPEGDRPDYLELRIDRNGPCVPPVSFREFVAKMAGRALDASAECDQDPRHFKRCLDSAFEEASQEEPTTVRTDMTRETSDAKNLKPEDLHQESGNTSVDQGEDGLSLKDTVRRDDHKFELDIRKKYPTHPYSTLVFYF